MNWAARTSYLSLNRLLTSLLLAMLAGLSHAQTPEAASAPEGAASASIMPMPTSASAPVVKLPPVSALADAPTWKALSPVQQQLLAPLARDWDRLSANQRTKWLNAAPLLASLPPTELERLHERMRDWSKLTPDERRDARIAYQFAKRLDAEKRRERWEAYQALPPEKRHELAEKAAARRRALATAPAASAHGLHAQHKSNLVPAAPKLRAQVPVNGSVIQARPGASTVLITQAPALPPHHVAGEPKVVADPALVNAKTLLPKALKAPQAASAAHP